MSNFFRYVAAVLISIFASSLMGLIYLAIILSMTDLGQIIIAEKTFFVLHFIFYAIASLILFYIFLYTGKLVDKKDRAISSQRIFLVYVTFCLAMILIYGVFNVGVSNIPLHAEYTFWNIFGTENSVSHFFVMIITITSLVAIFLGLQRSK